MPNPQSPQPLPAASPAPAHPQPRQNSDELEDSIAQAVGFILLVSEWSQLKLKENDDDRLLTGLNALADSTANRLRTAFYIKS